MRKKLMSCVVALAFMMSIGLNAGFAAPSSEMASEQASSAVKTLEKNPVTDQNAAREIINNISKVYTYIGGSLVAIGDQDKGFTLIRDGVGFMSIGYDPFTGGYAVSGINLTGSDWEAVEAAGGLKNYLMAMGIPETMLQVQEEVYDKDGNPTIVDADADKYTTVYGKDGTEYKTLKEYNNRKSVDVAWLSKAEESLKNGINHGISISFAGGPATLTTLKNGQAMESFAAQTYNGELFKTAEFKYNAAGFLTEQVTWNISAAYSSKAGEYIDALNKWLAQDPDNRKAEDFQCPDNLKASKEAFENEAGDITYEPRKTVIHYNLYGQAANITNHEGNLTNTYNYSSNGNLVSQVDHKNALTYQYQHGRITNVINEKGSILSQYTYYDNGALNYVTNYSNSVQSSMQIYLYGKDLGNVNFTGGIRTADQARADYLSATTPGKTEAQIRDILKASQFATVNFYGAHLSNTAFMNVMLNPSGDANKVSDANMALSIMTRNLNPHMAAGSSRISFDKNGKSEETYFTIEGSDKQYTQEEYVAYLESLGIEDPSIGSDISYGSGSLKETKKVTQHTRVTTWENFNVTTTINSRGQAAYDIEGTCKFNEKVGNWTTSDAGSITRQYDPAVIGTVNQYRDANGNIIEDVVAYRAQNPDATIYALVSSEGINMMDGSGFKPTDGEEIMIDISSLSDEDLSELAKTGRGLFMGNVNKTAAGQYVMEVKKEYNVEINGKNYGGFVTGADLEAAVQEVDNQSKAALNGESKYGWMNVNTNINRGLFGLGAGSYLNDWKAGWAILAGWND